jgi:hypothetical protein
MYIVQRALDLSTLRCIFFERKFSGAYKLLLSEKGTIYGGGESFSSLHIYISVVSLNYCSSNIKICALFSSRNRESNTACISRLRLWFFFFVKANGGIKGSVSTK